MRKKSLSFQERVGVRSFLGKYVLKYPHRNIQTARMLRKTMTGAERKLWSKLRANRFGVKFRRQVPFGNQDNALHQDKLRDQYFTKEGFTVLRFNNTEVTENMDGILETIW
jgi:very-short-patch-repair endonuclease